MEFQIRKYLASSLNNLPAPEVFELTRKLNRPFVEAWRIEQFFPYVERHLDLTFRFSETEVVLNFFFREGENVDTLFYCPIEAPKTIPRFFNFPLPLIEEEKYIILKSIIFDFGREHIMTPFSDKVIKRYDSIKPFTMRFDPESYDLRVIDFPLLNFSGKTNPISFDFVNTEIKELLHSFFPKVIQIDMLNQHSFETLNDSSTLQNFSDFSTFQKPGIRYLTNLSFKKNDLLLGSNDFEIEAPTVYSLEFKDDDPKHNINQIVKDEIKFRNNLSLRKVLEPVYELDEETKEEILGNLPTFQKQGVKFLFNSGFALLHDEFELGKETQVILAIKMLLRIRSIRKVLIVTSLYQECLVEFFGSEELPGMWQSKLSYFLPDFIFEFFTTTEKFKANKQNHSVILGLTYELLEESALKGELNDKFFSNYDLVVFDDFHKDLLELNFMEIFKNNVSPEKLWILSDSINDNLQDSLHKINPDKKLHKLGRTKIQTLKDSGQIFEYNFFIPLNPQNAKKSEEDFRIGQDKLDDVLGLGNILRFRPNVFQILQDEQRNLNFADNSNIAGKTDFLLYHLKKVFQSEDRILIYTQYDKQGLQPLVKLLDDHNYKYIDFISSDSDELLINKLHESKSHKGKLVYITNLKFVAIKFRFPKVSTIINFDNWWNPASRWLFEDKLENNTNSITVINYYYKDTIEGKLVTKLNRMGLNERLIFDHYPPEHFYTIFNEKHWCEFFQLENKFFSNAESSTATLNSMRELAEQTKSLFSKLRFKNIEATANVNDHSFDIRAEVHENNSKIEILGKCLFTDHLSSENINNLIKKMNSTEKADRIYIITNGTVSRTSVILPKNTLLIDGDRLKQYLSVIN